MFQHFSNIKYHFFFFHSRAHTIVGITFTQKSKNDAGQETAKKSVVNLVDLAGRFVKIATNFCIISLSSA